MQKIIDAWRRVRAPLSLLVVLALASAVLSAISSPTAAASVRTVAVHAAVHVPAPPPARSADVTPDNIGPRAWDRSTIVIQTMKAGNSAEVTWQHERISYYRNVAGSTLSLVEGSCQVNMPCIRVYWDFYGIQAWDGQTTEAYSGCITVNKWCRYDGTNSVVTHTTVQFDRSNGIDGRSAVGLQHLACHELGRAIAELTAAAGATCMSSNYAYPSLLASEEAAVRAKYSGVPRLASRADFMLAG